MGVKDLWSVLEPYSERKPLFELQGKVVAIDLAGWVCESLCVVDYAVQPRFYLRNLFFRTCYLLLSGVTPVYVLEGTAPALKYGVIYKRQQTTQFIGCRPRNNTTPASQPNNQLSAKPKVANRGRSTFNHVLKQCEELIVSMGLTCVQGPGEAEAFCAYLNYFKMVDGVISQDSDCFAYGATRVYRNFSVASQGKTAAQGGAVDVYDMNRVPKEMDFGQYKIIAMALLCGCDYCPDGVGGVGREATMKLFSLYSNNEILQRLKAWRDNANRFTDEELRVDDKGVCVNCGHRGKLFVHTKAGCADCRQSIGCNENLWKEQRLSIKSELMIRKKAMSISTFPSQAIIDEFLYRPEEMPHLELSWKQPNVVKFLRCMCDKLQWEEIYCFQKFLPILTRWQLYHFGDVEQCQRIKRLLGVVQPDYIKKKRSPKGIASYEIIWKDEEKCFDGLIPDEQLAKFTEENPMLLWSTIEPVDLVQAAYPSVVEQFFAATLAKSKKKTKSRKRETVPKTPTETAVAPKKRKKKESSKKTNEPARTPVLIDRFLNRIKSTRPKSSSRPVVMPPTVSPKIRTSSKPLDLSQFSLASNSSDWSALDDSQDMSSVINGIVTRPEGLSELCGRRLRYEMTEQLTVKNDQIAHAQETAGNTKIPKAEVLNSHDLDQYEKFSQNCNDLSSPNQSLDEFDLLVMGKGPALRPIADHSSTPISIRPTRKSLHTSAISLPESPTTQNSTSLSSPNNDHYIPSGSNVDDENINNVLNTSSFFLTHASTVDEMDEFEKSIDFRNMPDEYRPKNNTSSSITTTTTTSMRTSVVKVQDDSFNLSCYVPVGAKLRMKLN